MYGIIYIVLNEISIILAIEYHIIVFCVIKSYPIICSCIIFKCMLEADERRSMSCPILGYSFGWGPHRFSCHPRAFGVNRPFLINLRALNSDGGLYTSRSLYFLNLPKVSVAYPSLWMQFRAWSSANASTSNVLIKKSLAIAGDCACNSCFMTSLTSATGSRPGSTVNGQASQRKTGFEEWLNDVGFHCVAIRWIM